MEFVQKIVGTVRSTRADYNIPNKTKTDLYLETKDQDLQANLDKFKAAIGTLAYSNNVNVGQTPPSGCAIVTINDKVT